MKKLMTLVMMGAAAFGLQASLWTLPVKPVVKKVVGEVGAHAGGEVAARGTSKLAMVAAERAAARQGLASAAKAATPKKILAAGAATAVVVAGHEVADGIQSMAEDVGDAVKENPELASDVADKLFSPVRWLAGVLTLCLTVVGVWFMWPLVTLVRNWFKLRASLAQRRMDMEGVPATADAPAGSPHPGRTGRIGVRLLMALGAFALLTVIGISTLGTGSDKTSSGGTPARKLTCVDRSAEVERRKANVAKLRGVYEETVQKLYEDFKRDVDNTAEREFGRVRAGIGGIVCEYGTMSRCVSLVKAIAIDQWKGGNRAEQSIRKDLEANYYRGLYAARDQVVACVERFHRGLEMARLAFSAGVARELEAADLPGDEEYTALLGSCETRIEGAKHELLVGQITAGIAVAIEAALIRETVKTVGRVLGKAAARQAGTMAAGAGACVADGPLPVGDCIAAVVVAGCTAWTAWDVYNATEILPRAMEKALRSTTDECAGRCRAEVGELGGKIYRQYADLVQGR